MSTLPLPTPCQILLVDDDHTVLQVTSQLLGQAGYAVIKAGTCAQAWQMVSAHAADLVLLASHLPDGQGMDICRRVKADPALAGVLVILWSGHPKPGQEQFAGRNTGADGYIARPIENGELLARVDAYARLQQAQAQSRRLLQESERQHEVLLSVLEDARMAVAEKSALIDALPDVVMRFDRSGRHLFVSANVLTVVDLPAASFLGKTHRDLGFDEARCVFFETEIAAVFANGQAREAEIEMDTIHGHLTLNWRLVPDLDALGQVRSVLSLARDISAHKAAELARDAQLHELRRWHDVTLEREGRVMELKREINRLLLASGQPLRYPSVEGAAHA